MPPTNYVETLDLNGLTILRLDQYPDGNVTAKNGSIGLQMRDSGNDQILYGVWINTGTSGTTSNQWRPIGGTVSQPVLHEVQLGGVGTFGNIRQATAMYPRPLSPIQPSDGNFFVITDGVTTETFIFRAAAGAPFEVQIGGSLAATYANIATQITTDSPTWGAVLSTTLDELSSTGVVVIYRLLQAVLSYDDRIWGSFTGSGARPNLGNYTNQFFYSTDRNLVGRTISLSDPGVKRFFGFGIAGTTRLCNGDLRVSINDGRVYRLLGTLPTTLSEWVRVDDYVPASVPDWGGLAPTSVENALDRIAAALGPIP